jgi:hypothetical protein
MKWPSRGRTPTCALLLSILAAIAATPAAAATGPPPNDDFAAAVDLGNGQTASASGSSLWATAQPGEPRHPHGVARASVWYRWTAPRSGVVKVNTCASDFDTLLAVYSGSIPALTRVVNDDDGCGDGSLARFFAIAGTTYSIAVDGLAGAQGRIELRLRFLVPPANDDFANALDLGNRLKLSTSGTNQDATVEPMEPDHFDRNTIASVWYRWTPRASRRIRIGTCGSDLDTIVAVYRGAALDALTLVAANDDACGRGSRTRFRAVAGTTYFIAVAGYRRLQGTFALNLTPVRRRPHKSGG